MEFEFHCNWDTLTFFRARSRSDPIRFYPSALRLERYCHTSPSGLLDSCQTLRNAYLWNHWTDFIRSKFYGILYTLSCTTSWSFVHLPHMGLPMGQKLSRLYGMHFSATTGQIFSILTSIELSRPVVAQRHSNLSICPILACPSVKSGGSRLAVHISLKQLDGCTPFEVLWNCRNR